MANQEIKNAQSFCCGYNAVKSGRITCELTAREIQEQWPQHNTDSFAQGMLDALNKDPWRYRLLREEAGIRVYGGL